MSNVGTARVALNIGSDDQKGSKKFGFTKNIIRITEANKAIPIVPNRWSRFLLQRSLMDMEFLLHLFILQWHIHH